MLSFSDPLDFLISLPVDTRMSLDDLYEISRCLGFPQNAFPAVHVAGSNGKGSVCHKIASALEHAGYRVGLFTSPHIHCYSERIQINKKKIPLDDVRDILDQILPTISSLNLPINYFQVTTLVSLLYFKKMSVDVVVAETGIGGRLDATRLFDPILSVITSISLEHTNLLGHSLEAIGREKAGICKKEVPLVLGSRAAISSIFEVASSTGSPVYICDEVNGFYDKENCATAQMALSLLKNIFNHLTDADIRYGLTQRPQCRFERIGNFIFDVAHNPDGISRLFSAASELDKSKKIRTVIGLSSDKDIQGCLAEVVKYSSWVYLVETGRDKTVKLSELEAVMHALGCFNFTKCFSISQAVDLASKKSSDLIVVCGSFYIMDKAKSALSII